MFGTGIYDLIINQESSYSALSSSPIEGESGEATGAGGVLGKIDSPYTLNDIEQNFYDPNKASSTYSFSSSRLTISQGETIGRCYGRCRIAGNIIRNNDYENESYIKLLVGHTQGPIYLQSTGSTTDLDVTSLANRPIFLDAVLEDTNFSDLRFEEDDSTDLYEVRKYNVYGGTTTQEVIQRVFSTQNTAFKGLSVSEWLLLKGENLTSVDKLLVTHRWLKCLDIGSGSTDTDAVRLWSRNPAVVLWDFLINVEGYNKSQLDENAFTSLRMYCDEEPPFINPYKINPVGMNYNTIKTIKNLGNTNNTIGFSPWFAVNSSLSYVGPAISTSWKTPSGAISNQSFAIDFGVPYILTSIVLENFHDYGEEEDIGINKFVIQGTNDIETFGDNDYLGTSGGWNIVSGGTSLAAGTHIEKDDIDPQEFEIETTDKAYRYYRLKIQDNKGSSTYLGFRNVSFYGYSPERYTFDYNFDSDISINDAKKLIWKSFNGMTVFSQDTIKPVWDAAQEPDGAGGLQTKEVKYDFNLDNIVKSSFSFRKPKNTNHIKIKYINAHDTFNKTFIIAKNENDINLRGETKLSQECYFITEPAVASRRAKFLLDKSIAVDYLCSLRAFSSAQTLEVYDRVTVSHPMAGWNQKDFFITSKREDIYGRCTFSMMAYNAGIYHDEGYEEQENFASNLTKATAKPTAVENLNATDASYFDNSGNWVPKLNITYDLPKPSNFSHCKIYYQIEYSGIISDFVEYGIDNSRGAGFDLLENSEEFKQNSKVTVAVYAVNTLGLSSTSLPTNVEIETIDLKEIIENTENEVLILPKGTYTTDTQIVLPERSFSITGVNKEDVLLRSDHAGGFFVFPDTTDSYEFNFSNLTWHSSTTKVDQQFIRRTSLVFNDYLGNETVVSFSNIKFNMSEDYTSSGATGEQTAIHLVYCRGILNITNCEFYNGKPVTAVKIGPVNFLNNFLSYSAQPTYFEDTTTVIISENTFENLRSTGLEVFTITNSGKITNNIMISDTDNEYWNKTSGGWGSGFIGIHCAAATEVTDMEISGNNVSYNAYTGSMTTIKGIYCLEIFNSRVRGNYVTIDTNTSLSNRGAGIEILGGANNIISENTILLEDKEGSRANYIYGLYLWATLSNVISNNNINLVNNDATYDIGIHLGDISGTALDCDYCYGDGNITENVGISIEDYGTGNNVSAQDI